jgi:hypothetical protein
VGVEHDLPLREVVVDRGVDHEPARVHVGGAFEHVAVTVDLDQVRRSDLVVEQPELVQEEVVVRARNAHADVVPDEVVVTEVRSQPVHRRQVHTRSPFVPDETARVGRSEIVGPHFPVPGGWFAHVGVPFAFSDC